MQQRMTGLASSMGKIQQVRYGVGQLVSIYNCVKIKSGVFLMYLNKYINHNQKQNGKMQKKLYNACVRKDPYLKHTLTLHPKLDLEISGYFRIASTIKEMP